MNASEILSEHVIQIKRGRQNSFGWEPAWNSYFDFYISPKYIDPPLIKLEDGMFHLFLRKNLNDRDKSWRMPSYRQMMRRLGISQKKIEGMMERLEQAHLLTKESGYRKGPDQANIQNTYILSDPIQTLDEFLTVASEGAFGVALKPEWLIQQETDTPENAPHQVETPPCMPEAYRAVGENDTGPVGEKHTYKQTSSSIQTSAETVNPLWQTTLDSLQLSLQAKTFERFLGGTDLLEIANDTAVIGTPQAYARDWIENRLADKLKRLLGVAAVRCVVLGDNGA